MNNYDIILLSILFILCIILLTSNLELFNQYPLTPLTSITKLHNMSRNDFIILNNFLKNVKNKLNKQSNLQIDTKKLLYPKIKLIQKLPESDKLAKKVVKIFNSLNQYNKIKLYKTTDCYINIYNNFANINFNMIVNYKISQNKSLVLNNLIRNKANNVLYLNIDIFVKLDPKPNFKNIYFNDISLTYYKKLWYLPGNYNYSSFSTSSTYSKKLINSKSYNDSILKNKKINKLKARLNALLKKRKKNKNIKEKYSSSISETVANPKTEELNEYFSHMN
jgi:hypothetical protein